MAVAAADHYVFSVSTEPALSQLRPIHPFPARMAPVIVWEELIAASSVAPRGHLRVLDQMAGSGTTVAMARMLGHQALGFDTDPLAVLIAQAWSADVAPDELRDAAQDVVRSARVLARSIAVKDSYPDTADEETRRFVRYWFDQTARRHLTALSAAIREFKDDSLHALLWCGLSRLIVVKSMGASLAIDVAHSRPHKVYARAPIRPLLHFERAMAVVAKNCPFSDGLWHPPATVRQGDARRLPLEEGAADFVITSPPYLNAIDYLRGHKFSLVWMGYTVSTLRSIRATNVGSEVSAAAANESPHIERALCCMGDIDRLPGREVGMLRRYLLDMDAVMAETARVLAPAGRAVLVIGDSTLRGVFIRNSKAVEILSAKHSLRPLGRRHRALPPNRRYLPPPGAEGAGKQLEGRMREEVILSFTLDKPSLLNPPIGACRELDRWRPSAAE